MPPMAEVVQKDINWFLLFVKNFNSTATYIYDNLHCPDLIELDACLFGLGGRLNQYVYTLEFQNNETPSMFKIVHFEMWNVSMWQGKRIIFKCDNEAVVSVINTGVTKDNDLPTLECKIWLETAPREIVHIRSKDNKFADLLSHWHLVDHNMDKLMTMIEQPVCFNVNTPLIASLGTTWNISNVLMIYAIQTGWCSLESIDTEIKHLDN